MLAMASSHYYPVVSYMEVSEHQPRLTEVNTSIIRIGNTNNSDSMMPLASQWRSVTTSQNEIKIGTHFVRGVHIHVSIPFTAYGVFPMRPNGSLSASFCRNTAGGGFSVGGIVNLCVKFVETCSACGVNSGRVPRVNQGIFEFEIYHSAIDGAFRDFYTFNGYPRTLPNHGNIVGFLHRIGCQTGIFHGATGKNDLLIKQDGPDRGNDSAQASDQDCVKSPYRARLLSSEVAAFLLLSIVGIGIAYESFREAGKPRAFKLNLLPLAGMLGGACLGSYSLLMLVLAIS